MKRFWQSVEITEDFRIELDRKNVHTPKKNILYLPNLALAEAVAGEWADAPDEFDPRTMPMTRLANTALDRIAPDAAPVLAELEQWAGSDAICYRALEPEDLVQRQMATWDPILAWAFDTLGASFIVIPGLTHKTQPASSVARLVALWRNLDAFTLAGLHNLSALGASALIATAFERQFLDADQAWKAASLDEEWQLEFWGRDKQAILRLGNQCLEFSAAAQFIKLASLPGA